VRAVKSPPAPTTIAHGVLVGWSAARAEHRGHMRQPARELALWPEGWESPGGGDRRERRTPRRSPEADPRRLARRDLVRALPRRARRLRKRIRRCLDRPPGPQDRAHRLRNSQPTCRRPQSSSPPSPPPPSQSSRRSRRHRSPPEPCRRVTHRSTRRPLARHDDIGRAHQAPIPPDRQRRQRRGSCPRARQRAARSKPPPLCSRPR